MGKGLGAQESSETERILFRSKKRRLSGAVLCDDVILIQPVVQPPASTSKLLIDPSVTLQRSSAQGQ